MRSLQTDTKALIDKLVSGRVARSATHLGYLVTKE